MTAAFDFERPRLEATAAVRGGGLAGSNRMLALLNGADRATRIEFLRLIGRQRGVATLKRLTTLFEAGRYDEALALLDDVAPSFAAALNQAYITAGQSTAAVIGAVVGRPLLTFDTTNQRAVARMSATRARLVAAMSMNERERLTLTLRQGIAEGLRTDQIARLFRDNLGLTPAQQTAVRNYRRALQAGNTEALNRALRDRRFDATVRRAAAEGVPLTPAQLDRMEARYRERFIQYRARTIARTEALAAVHEADEEMWGQAVESGIVQPSQIETRWVTAGDERVRGSHASMNGQTQPFGVPYTSGDGNQLRFPGDRSAPAGDVINCRCVLARTIRR